MSKERNLSKIARITAAGFVVGSIVSCQETSQNVKLEPAAQQPQHSLNLSQEEIESIKNEEAINYLVASYKTPIPETVLEETSHSVQTVPEVVKKPSIEIINEELLNKYKSEIPQILDKIELHPEIFKAGTDEEDLLIYYPIYRAAQDKFGVEWYTLWLIHQQESTVSRNPAAFEEGSMHFGAMQRSPEYHPQVDVDRYFQGMEYLNSLPTRNITDAKEIIYAGASIAENTNITGSLLGALNKYSAAGPAANRYERYLVLNSVFSQQE